ncbi:MAG: hypothetical protein HQM08_13050 [Candidatus Riflebacteria bacterium]|nr:hypothetical protein [Candidatus Riflebacteria bacterium]
MPNCARKRHEEKRPKDARVGRRKLASINSVISERKFFRQTKMDIGVIHAVYKFSMIKTSDLYNEKYNESRKEK